MPRRHAADKLRSDLLMAGRNLEIIRSSTLQVSAPWLLREMAPRIGATLNYFLLHLTGSRRICAHLTRAVRACMRCLCGTPASMGPKSPASTS